MVFFSFDGDKRDSSNAIEIGRKREGGPFS